MQKVILVGRTEFNLENARKELADQTSSSADDIGVEVVDLQSISQLPDFVEKITKTYPDLDAILLNAGVQKVLKVHLSPLRADDGRDVS